MAWFGAFRKKSYIATLIQTLSGTLWPKRDFRSLAEEGYKTNPTVYACINEIATAVAAVPWFVGRMRNGQVERDEKHPLNDLLLSPNPDESLGDLTACELSDYLLSGNGFTYLVGPKGPFEDVRTPLTKPPIGIWNVQPGVLKALVDEKTGQLRAWSGKIPGANSEEIHPSRVIHRKTYNPLDPIFGMSPLEAAARDVDTMNEGLTYNYGLMRNAGQPAGVILLKGKAAAQQKAKGQADVDATFNNPNVAGRWKIIEGAEEVEVKALGLTPKDMEFLAGRTANAIGICNVFNVPPEIVGVQGQKTYANYQEARKAFYQECVIPHLNRLQEARQRRLAALYGTDVVIRYDKDTIDAVQEDRNATAARTREDFRAGLITANEARKKNGDPEATDPMANERMLPLSVIPASEAGAPVEPVQTQPAPASAPADEEDDPEDDPTDEETRSKKADRQAAAPAGLPMTTKADGLTIFKAFDRKRATWNRRAQLTFLKPLKADYANAAEAVRQLPGTPNASDAYQAVSKALASGLPDWEKAMTAIWTAVALDFAGAVDQGLQEGIKGVRGPEERKAGEQEAAWIAATQAYLKTQGTRIVRISDYTRRRIMGAVAQGVEAGEGADLIADRIDAQASLVSGRALRIARTEVIGASNLGSDVAARSFDVPLLKGWLDTGDNRERDTHRAAAQQKAIGLDEPFTVGNSSVMFPGDASLGAEAGEIINCRCTQVYTPAGQV